MRKSLIAVALAAACAVATDAAAQSYPSRPVTVIVPFAAGGPSDVLARVLGERMRAALNQTVIVENVTGAAGTIGVTRVVRAAADGYTVSFGHLGTHVINGAIYPLTFDLLNDLDPVGLVGANPMLVVSKNAVPGKELKGLIAWIKANEAKLVDFFKQKGLTVTEVNKDEFRDTVIKTTSFESFDYRKSDWDRIQAVK